jgi:hypothetical protein
MTSTPLPITRSRSLLCVLALLSGGACIGAHAESQTQTIEQAAADVLRATSEHLAAAKMLSFRATTLYDVVAPSGIKTKVVKQTRFFVKRPDRLHVRAMRDDGAQRQFWYDGKTFSRYEPASGTASRMDAPATIDALLDRLADEYRVSLPLADLLYGDPYGAFREHLLSGAYLGKRLVDGVWCHHLSFESDGADFQLWITTGDDPLPRRFVVTYVEEPEVPELLATFTDWNLEAYMDEGVFRFTPPSGIEEKPFEPAAR